MTLEELRKDLNYLLNEGISKDTEIFVETYGNPMKILKSQLEPQDDEFILMLKINRS